MLPALLVQLARVGLPALVALAVLGGAGFAFTRSKAAGITCGLGAGLLLASLLLELLAFPTLEYVTHVAYLVPDSPLPWRLATALSSGGMGVGILVVAVGASFGPGPAEDE